MMKTASLRVLIIVFLVIGPLSAHAVTQQDVLKYFQSFNRPFPSAGSKSSDTWDMMVVSSVTGINNGFKHLYGDRSHKEAIRAISFTDCATSTRWLYPTGTCFSITGELDAPKVISMSDSSKAVVQFSFKRGIAWFNIPEFDDYDMSGNRTQDLNGLSFIVTMDIKQSIDGETIKVHLTGKSATASIALDPSRFPLLVINKMSELFREKVRETFSSPDGLRLVTFNAVKSSGGTNIVLVPTHVESQMYETSSGYVFVYYIMTEDRLAPAVTYFDEKKSYLPDDMNTMLLISNRLFVSRMIPSTLPHSFQVNSTHTKGKNHLKLYNIEGLIDTNLTFKGVTDYHYGVLGCESNKPKYKNYQIQLPFHLGELSGKPTETITFDGLQQQFKLKTCYANSIGRGAIHRHVVSLDYKQIVKFSVSGGNLTTTMLPLVDHSDIPSSKIHWYDTYGDKEKFVHLVQSLKDSKGKVEKAINFATFIGSFNIFKEESMVFSLSDRLNFDSATLIYDMILFGKANSIY